MSFVYFLKKSLIGYFKKVPKLKLDILEVCLWTPITLLFEIFNIGEPDVLSIIHLNNN